MIKKSVVPLVAAILSLPLSFATSGDRPPLATRYASFRLPARGTVTFTWR